MAARSWLLHVLASAALVAPALGQAPITLEWVDAAGEPISQVHEFATARLRVINPAYTCWGYQMVQVSSDLRGDEGGYSLFESPSCSGIFSTSFPVVATTSTAPPQTYDGTMEVTELAGPPFQRDTLRAMLQPCYPPTYPCFGDAVPVVGSTVRLTDSAWNDSDLLGFHLYVEVEDHSPSFSPEVTVTTPAGDVEVVALGAGAGPGTHRGTLDVAFAAAVPNDGILQVQEGEVVTASHPDPLGLSSATDTAIAGGARIDVLDRQGAPVSFVLADGDLRVRVHYPVRNADPAVAEVVVLHVNTRDPWGGFADSETLALYETGPDTGVFAIDLPTQSNSFPQQGDWRLQVRGFYPYYAQNDRVELQIYDTLFSSTLDARGSQLRLIDATGSDLEHFRRGDAVRIRVESETQNYSPDTADALQVRVRATTIGDDEWVQLQETGPDTATFEGTIATAASEYAAVGDGVAQVRQDETLRAEHETAFGIAADEATAGDGDPATLPPNANDDTAYTDDGTPVAIDVLANDYDPEGKALQTVGFTQGTHGSVSGGGPGPLTYTPGAYFAGTDTFTYRVRDADGDESEATVTVNVQLVNQAPAAADDSYEVDEDTALWFEPLTNDVDPENEGLTVNWAHDGAGGTVTVGPGTSMAYRPSPNFYGDDSFLYQVADPFGVTDVATVHVTVRPSPDPPAPTWDELETDEDVPVLLDVLVNDHDPDGEVLQITAVGTSTFGVATIENNRVRFIPGADKKGTAVFSYTVADPGGLSASSSVIVTINSIPDAPVANPDIATTAEETALTIAVLANDTDGDSEALSVGGVGQGAHGTVTVDASQRAVYTPAADFFGSDTFTYTAADPTGRTATGTVTVTVTNVAEAPDARDDAASTDEDTPVTMTVLANDSDADGDALSITAATQGTHGGVTFTSSALTYTPAANYDGADSFTYTVDDGSGRTDTATVTITVVGVNDPPVATADSASTAEDTAVTIAALANDSDADGDTLAITAVTQGARGTVTFTTDALTYTPAANANGSDSFTYTLGDGQGGSATATVAVTITAVNDPPDAGADGAGTNEDTPVTIAVLANDVDPDGEAPTLVGVTAASQGTVVANGNGTVTYLPAANTAGVDAFTYTVRDAAGLTDTATVAVSVAPVNDAPDAIDDSATTNEGSAVTIAALGNDTDIDGGPLAVTAVGAAAHGVATANANGTITYTPAAGYGGPDSFTYTASDGAATDTATVSVVVKDVIGNVAVLGTHGVWLRSGVDVLSGDVIVNAAGAAPFLTGSVELTIGGGGATTAAGWDVEANRVAVDSGATVASDVYSNQLTNNGTISGTRYSPLALPVFATLPAFHAATPGAADVSVANNGNRTLAAGSYRDLIVGRKGTVTFTGGTYHFRSLRIDREAKLLFAAAAQVRVQDKVSTGITTTIGPAPGSGLTAAAIVFYVGGINGTGGGVNETPAATLLGATNTITANLYSPNGTLWLGDNGVATGTLFARDVRVGLNAQVSLSSAW